MALHIYSKNYLIITLAIVFIVGGVFLFSLERPLTPTENNETPTPEETPINIVTGPVSPITGESCLNAAQRPIGIMLAGDAVTRPLSGIGQADLVIEMPVITGGITRYLAVYVCQKPTELGSVRSARDDFIPLALGLDAIYGHWGGSHFALDELKNGIIDNVNALTNPHGAYFRKPGIAEPHNGFTSYDRLFNASQKIGYRLAGNLEAYPHHEPRAKTDQPEATLKIPYPGQFRVDWLYDPAVNKYTRQKGGEPEVDANTKAAVTASVIVVLRSDIKQIEGQYNDVRVIGTGRGVVYEDGYFFEVTWRKPGDLSRLQFLLADNTELQLAPGQMWWQYVANDAAVSYEVAD